MSAHDSDECACAYCQLQRDAAPYPNYLEMRASWKRENEQMAKANRLAQMESWAALLPVLFLFIAIVAMAVLS